MRNAGLVASALMVPGDGKITDGVTEMLEVKDKVGDTVTVNVRLAVVEALKVGECVTEALTVADREAERDPVKVNVMDAEPEPLRVPVTLSVGDSVTLAVGDPVIVTRVRVTVLLPLAVAVNVEELVTLYDALALIVEEAVHVPVKDPEPLTDNVTLVLCVGDTVPDTVVVGDKLTVAVAGPVTLAVHEPDTLPVMDRELDAVLDHEELLVPLMLTEALEVPVPVTDTVRVALTVGVHVALSDAVSEGVYDFDAVLDTVAVKVAVREEEGVTVGVNVEVGVTLGVADGVPVSANMLDPSLPTHSVPSECMAMVWDIEAAVVWYDQLMEPVAALREYTQPLCVATYTDRGSRDTAVPTLPVTARDQRSDTVGV